MSTPDSPSDAPTRTIELPAGPMSIADEGEAEPAFVLIHGLPGSVRDFRWLTPCLAPMRRIRLEMPGFGGTPLRTEPDPGVDARARVVLQVCDALGLERPILVGHSMGGAIGCRAVSLAPARFGGLALISSPGLRPHREFRVLPRRTLSWVLRRPAAARLLRPLLRAAFRSGGFPHGTHEERLLTIHCLAAMSFPEHSACLRAVELPLFHAYCLDDPLIEADIMEQTARTKGGPVHRYDDGGHNPQKHHAVELGEALCAWAQSLPDAGPT